MSSVRIILPDKKQIEFDHKPTVLEVAEKIGPRLAKETVGGIVNNEFVDFRDEIADGSEVKIVTLRDDKGNEVIRHSAAHVMAQAVQELWPEIKVTIGPVIDKGFYYDFDAPKPFSPEDLEKIEAKMQEIIKRDEEIVRETWPAKKAIEVFSKMGETFKVELIEDLGAEEVTIYRQGEWFDLCRGPHVPSTSYIKSFKLLSIAGAYWRGDEKNKQLQRIYATAFNDKKELKKYLLQLEEAKKRDHRKLGKELGLFYFHQLSPGGPFFSGKGAVLYNELQGFLRDMYYKYGYQEVITPQMYNTELYEISGHRQNYDDNMYFLNVDEQEHSLKPMNCPGHCLLFQMEHHSYRDLPLRMADFGRLHRNERGGTMHGLNRVRTFAQDDAHMFCTMDQLQEEIKYCMTLVEEIYRTLGMAKYKMYLATRPEKRVGAEEVWDKAEEALKQAVEELGIDYEINPGDGAFYGPKLDICFYDAIDREWQLGTLQCDFNLPERFGLEYIGEDNKAHRPVMLHRAILGSLERFIGVYTEHVGGKYPTWMAPVQAIILNVTDRSHEYGEKLFERLRQQKLRVEFDKRNEKLGFKIREAQLQKIPYMLVIGDKEVENETVTVRLLNGENHQGVAVEEFVAKVQTEIRQRDLVSPYRKKDSTDT
jgi:threonyl-tRNA synthetase